MKKSGLTLGIAALAMGLSGAAFAVVENDGPTCNSTSPDANGGCNNAVPAFQDLGALADGVTSITGTCGTYDPAGGTNFTSRDLDWYSFSIAQGRLVTFTFSTTFVGIGGPPSNQNVLFVGTAPDCGAVGGQPVFYGVQAASPQSVAFFLDAGTYIVIGTSPFEATPAGPQQFACGTYTLNIDVASDDNTAICNESTSGCDVVHDTPGCSDFSCCETACLTDPLCCFEGFEWDQHCVDLAVSQCGYFIYTCNATGNSPPNDCLTAPTLIDNVGCDPVVVAFDTTNAKTDGPSNTATGAASLMGKDLWYVIKAPENGALTVSQCEGTTYDGMMEIYNLGTSPTVDDIQQLPAAFIGQVDDTCGGVAVPATLTLIDALADNYYLIRVGGFDADQLEPTTDSASGAGSLTISFVQILYYTGPQKFVVALPSTNTNLGLSSGAIAAASPQRWYAAPFTAGPGPSGGDWELTEIIAKGFVPAAPVSTTDLHWIIWNRTGLAAPVDGDQLLSGTIPYPVPYDNGVDSAANASHSIPVAAGTMLSAGDYYLTVYGSNPTDFAAGGTTASNFAWFIYVTEGINNTSPNLHGWRSATFPAPGFVSYTALNGVYTVQAGDDPNDLYNVAFQINGKSCGIIKKPCVGDLDGNGVVDASDLGILLGGWAQPGISDINGSGTTDASDLGLLLGGWGTCP